MNPSLGARLRTQRERQQVDLTAIAAETKIQRSLLEGLERDDISQWPHGIFRHAYVRAYARAVGLDGDAVVREFLDFYGESADVLPRGAIVWPATERDAPPHTAKGFRRLVTSAMAAVPSFVQRAQSIESDAARPAPPESSGGPVADVPPPLADGTAAGLTVSLSAAADLCTRLGRVLHKREIAPIFEDAAKMIDAVGVVLWFRDARGTALRPWLAHGYSDAVLARFDNVRMDAGNAIAAAFRSGETCVVDRADAGTGAVVVPLLGPTECIGVLALELRDGGEQQEPVRAFATILAAQLVTLLGSVPVVDAATA